MSGCTMTRHLNGGKWSEEEELYAASLMDAFKAGELPASDCPEGTSLRKYLAKKLMCSPKRVSKKFEGTGYNGKQVYFKKDTTRYISNPILEAARQSRLQDLERQFLCTLAEMKHSNTPANACVAPKNLPRNSVSSPSASLPFAVHRNSVAASSSRSDTLLAWPESSAAAALRARSDLSALIQHRNMLDQILSESESGPVAGLVGERALQSTATSAVEMILGDTRIAAERQIRAERIQQAALASSLAKYRAAPLTSSHSNLPGTLNYQSLLRSGKVTAELFGIGGLSHQQVLLPEAQQLRPPRRPLAEGQSEHSVKRARLHL